MRTPDVSSLRVRLLVAAGALTAVSLYGAARAKSPPEKVCIPAKADGTCPSDEDALTQIGKLEADGCPSLATPGAVLENGQCCYEVGYDCPVTAVGCNYPGHPLRVESRPREEASRHVLAWQEARLPAPDVSALSRGDRQLLAFHWARVGAAEVATIKGFQRLVLDLTTHASPPALVAGARQAARAEGRHARLAFTLASAFAGAPVGPRPLDLSAPAASRRSLADLALVAASEGCTEETLSACLLAEALHHATDPAVASALRQMTRDENEHAVLAWQILRWALSREPALAGAVDVALQSAARELTTDGFAHPAGLPGFGLLLPAQAEARRVATLHGVIEPCREALLRRSAAVTGAP